MNEHDALQTVADLMCLAARTAPKTRGVDVVLIRTTTEGDRARLADEMDRIAAERDQAFFARDAENLRASGACVVIAARSHRAGLAVCSWCGHASCEANEAAGGTCVFNHIDLGIAASSAAGAAALHHADTRIMYTIGTAARNIDLFDEPTTSALGLPLSATGKSPYFDRKMPAPPRRS